MALKVPFVPRGILLIEATPSFKVVRHVSQFLVSSTEHNLRSAAVLVRAGFVEIGSETSYADGLGRDVVEDIYRLAR